MAMPSTTSQVTNASPPLTWINGFHRLGEPFVQPVPPLPLPDVRWVSANRALARELGLSGDWLASDEALQLFAGNSNPPGSQTVASVYSGHQFGVWAGQLGDGRALLLGELDSPRSGQELQLKGSGRTPYSRMGDGRAVLRSSIREYLCSEAMHGLGIPSTRALALVTSPERVRRETMETAAVVTRVAPSFIRFGHFEHFAHSGQHAALRTLADYVIDRYYPACRHDEQFPHNPYAALLREVAARTATLLAQWQAAGFCHGVLNTDNMSILGLTLDYGPFQFMDSFDFGHVCNHSDTHGRYAFGRQPAVAHWNLLCLGQALLPLIQNPEGATDAGDTQDALTALEAFKTSFPQAFLNRMRAKLGLPDGVADEQAQPLVERLLQLLHSNKTDYPAFWCRLTQAAAPAGDLAMARSTEALRDLFVDRAAFDAWMLSYRELTIESHPGQAYDLMKMNNPQHVLRNHLAQQAIQSAQAGDFEPVNRLLLALQAPFEHHPGVESAATLPPDWAGQLSLSCSS